MTDKLYKMMNWPEIEAICYGDSDNPHAILGAMDVDGDTLIQTFYPDATKVFCRFSSKDAKEIEMEKADESGFFACLVKGQHTDDYKFKAVLEDGETEIYGESYNMEPVVPEEVCKQFMAGVCYDIYRYLGAHPTTINGKKGVAFAVWAPNAVRVSVVGDFNTWNGLRHPMRRIAPYGIFELFVPDAKPGDNYKYEICIRGGATVLKADPYANAMQLRPDNASVITDISKYRWQDALFMKKRGDINAEKKPINVYEVHLGSFDKPDDGREFYNYTELAPKLIEYVQKMGYTHVELMPIMEHPLDESWGYQVIGYYAPTARYGTPVEFMEFVNELHKAGIGVILDWVPAHFPRDVHGLSCFDGTCLYEHSDPMRAYHPQWGTLNYNYGRTEVSNYLIANALFWLEMYHIDGIRMDAVASMLYLDFGKAPGQWYANMYGGNENLEAVEFLKHINSIIHKKYPEVMTIAEESSAWPRVTGDLNEEGLGFDYKWNLGWMNDYLKYISYDPYFRSHHHNELTFSMIYAYTERFMLEFSHDEVVHGKATMLNKMPGTLDDKFANLRLSYAYMMMHPGKKLLFMGQDIAETREWCEKRSIQWDLLEQKEHERFQNFVKDCNHFYLEHPALFELDYQQEGFEWINHILAEQNMLIFLRRSEEEKELLVIVANFANVARNNYVIGVPFEGRYKEIFNSDHEKYGGAHYINSRVKMSKEMEADYRPYSINIRVAPLSLSVFKFMGEKIVSLEEEKKKRTSTGKEITIMSNKTKKKAVIKPIKNI